MSMKKILLSTLCVVMLNAFPAQAGEQSAFGPFMPLYFGLNELPANVYGPYRPADFGDAQVQTPFTTGENGLALRFAGKQEEGALSLFVKTDSFSKDQADRFADDLNAISPAAGIQFTMDFNL